MLRHKSTLHLDAHYNNMIENAFYYTVPSEQSKVHSFLGVYIGTLHLPKVIRY